MSLPGVLRVFWVGAVAGLGVALGLAWWGWQAGRRAEEWNPLAGVWFADLLEYRGTMRLVHTSAFLLIGAVWFPFAEIAASVASQKFVASRTPTDSLAAQTNRRSFDSATLRPG